MTWSPNHLPNPLESSALARPNHPAFVMDETLTYAELRNRVARTACALVAAGVKAGDTVALVAPLSAEWVVAFHAIGWLGGAAAVLDPDAPADALETQIDACGANSIVSDRAIESSATKLPWPLVQAQEPLLERPWELSEIRCVVVTSGTTGTPKVIRLTTGQLVFSAMGSMVRLGHDVQDRWLLCLPVHHVGGLSVLIRCAWLGTTVVAALPFNANTVNRGIDSGDATLVSVVPIMLEKLLDARADKPFPDTLRVLLVGGDRCPAHLRKRLQAINAPVRLTWGMTECGSQIATQPSMDGADAEGIGPAMPFARVSNIDGQLGVFGPIAPGGQIVTRDMGDVDAKGRVHVHGRADDLIIAGGKNIAPAEVESILMRHPKVQQAVVVGRSHPTWGQTPLAIVVFTDESIDSAKMASDLAGMCAKGLAPHKRPRHLYSIAAIPTLPNGKTDRGRLRLLCADLGGCDELELVEDFEETLWDRAGLEGLEVNDSVDEGDRGSEVPIFAEDSVVKDNRGLLDDGGIHHDAQPVSESHRGFVVGFGVDKRHPPAAVREDASQSVAGCGEHFLEGVVTVLVDPAEKSDAGPVNFIESNGDNMVEGHKPSKEKSKGGGS